MLQAKTYFGQRGMAKPVPLVQYDDTLPIIAAALYLGDRPYTVPDGAAINIRMAKRDGTYVYNPALGVSEDRQTAYIAVTYQMTVLAGSYLPILELVVNGNAAGTSELPLDIAENPMPEDAIASRDEYKTIQQLAAATQQAAKIINDNKQAIQDIEDNMDAIQGAAGNAQSAAASASQAQQYAAQAKDYADSINPDNFQQKAIIADAQSATPKTIYPYVSQGRQVILTRDGYTFENWSIASPLIMSIIPKDVSVNTRVGSVTYVMLYGNYQQSGGWTFYEFTLDTDEHCPYAVGDVYITSKAGNPSTRWPGTSWTQIKDCFLLAAGDSYKAGSAGGSKTHSHKLSSAAYAKIGFGWINNYNTLVQGETVEGDSYSGSQMSGLPSFSNLESSNVCTPLGGQTDAQTLMPPYKAYYMWERTA